MKNNLENSIKDSLKDFEMPYNPKAWDALSSKLGATPSSSLENGMKESLQDLEMPYNPKAWDTLRARLDAIRPGAAPRSYMKWYAIAATGLVATVGLYYYLTHDDHKEEKTILVQNDTSQVQGQSNDQNSTINGDLNSSVQNHANTTSSTNESGAANESNGGNTYQTNIDNTTQTGTVNGSSTGTNTTVGTTSGSNGSASGGDNSRPGSTDGTSKINFVAPTVSNLCMNEKVELSNNNELKLWVIAPSGESFHVKPMQSNTFSPSEAGVHKLGYYNTQGFVESGSFNVRSLPFVDFYVDMDQKYENGLPVTKVETDVPGSNFKWTVGNITSTGREAEGHFFKKGYYDITLNVTGANGCTNSKTQNVFIEHEYGDRGNYNLLAPSGIHLNSTDEKNRSFMPEGLKHRDVKFRMVIYSLQDGHIVYETHDNTKPWTGIDQATGRQVGHATSYHWEITIENPMQGESPSYKGALTVLVN